MPFRYLIDSMDTPRWTFALAIITGLLFTSSSLGTCIMVGLNNSDWTTMKDQAKLLMCIGIFVNWSGTMMAWINKALHTLSQGKFPTFAPPGSSTGDTEQLTKAQVMGTTSSAMKTSIAIGLLLAGSLMGPLAMMQGCSGPNRAAYVAETGTRVSVETAMGYFDQLVKAGKVSLADQAKVRDGYNKVRLSMIALTDAGKTAAAAAQTNGGAALQAGVDQLASDYAQNKTDLFNLLSSLGVKL